MIILNLHTVIFVTKMFCRASDAECHHVSPETLQFSFNGHTSVMRHYLLFSLVLIFLYIVSSHAETVTRIESGSWTEISQWSPAKVPDEKDDVVIPDGFLVDVISAVKIQSFSAAEISTLTVNANFEVTSPVPGKQ